MNLYDLIAGLISLIALTAFFVMCNTIARMKDNQEKLLTLLEEQGKKQEKHNNYMENNIYSIKQNTTKTI